MKKGLIILLLLLVLISVRSVYAEKEVKRNYDVAEGEGWLVCTINDEEVEFKYVGSVKSMTDTVHNFESDHYTLRIIFNKLEIGVPVELNALKSMEMVSTVTATSGYYATKKSRTSDVDSYVLLEKPLKEGILQGGFHAVITAGDRWVGDLRPGIIAKLPLEDGEFCFYPTTKK